MEEVAQVRAEYDDLLAALSPGRREDTDVREVRWMLEELRVSLFAQPLRTPYPVSAGGSTVVSTASVTRARTDSYTPPVTAQTQCRISDDRMTPKRGGTGTIL